ncbi:N-acetylglucosamine-6-sulfatase-like isoform X1 [Daphnia carinata]|uniref:N-acetylglucosamine-6-sulfatase-like isoform X1 n=1 Tax=Daphnia carinata TaxID=120202 RepID=UPI00257F7D76|nr:N-acetylglucosamine-6-sulfatase-like isoform X1 [Daphnia carinata]
MRKATLHLVSIWFTLFIGRLNCKTPPNARPNIVLILIDDLDYVLGGLEPMAITRRLVSQHGATFTNAFISTPVCCPSRSSILTGKYVHNHRVINNTATGNCSSRQWQDGEEHKTMATYLQANGYATFYGGKYLNQYGKNETGGVEHVPPGYNRWVGLVGNSRYYNYTLSVDGRRRDHGEDYHRDYLTDVLAREALSFIDGVAPNRHPSSLSAAADSRPFFAVIAPPACHSPFTPAPQHSRKFAGRRAPRSPSFNRHPADDKHWLLRQAPQGALPKDIVRKVDHVFRQRWRTLLSVDQMIGNMVKLLRRKGQLDRTWMIVTSDHGYHMGQFAMPIDKRLPYETDIRVPLLVVAASHNRPTANNKSRDIEIDSLSVVSIDLAPTVLDMAGLPVPDQMDGVSLLPLMANAFAPPSHHGNVSKEVSRVAEPRDSHWRGIDESAKPWRTFYLIEYHGEADLQDVDLQCQQDANTTLCLDEFGCKCQDAANNTFVCLRTLRRPTDNQHANEDSLYCQFDDSQAFVESYDLRLDPYQLNNRAYRRSCRCTVPSHRRRELIINYSKCRGHVNCSGVSDNQWADATP